MISCCPHEGHRDYVNKETICITANYCVVQWHKQINQRNYSEKQHDNYKCVSAE